MDSDFMDGQGRTLETLQAALQTGKLSSLELVEDALARAQDPSGEGGRTFVHLQADAARKQARASDRRRAQGRTLSPLDGLPVSVKDLFDIEGQVTTAGSVVLADEPPAPRNATSVQRLLDAGAVLMGRTNMTEFAYSGVGLNPHYGTPRNPWDRSTGRIPGGSSSGAAVSVSDGMAAAALGTDTGGSVRIPAALCGLTGFKPTARRVPRQGALPLSTHLDAIGSIGMSLACCARMDSVLSRQPVPDLAPLPWRGFRLVVPTTLAFDRMDREVGDAFERALRAISAAGATLEHRPVPEFAQLADINARGGFTALEAWSDHGERLQAQGDRFDPRVRSRMLRGRDHTVADLLALVRAREAWIAAVEDRLHDAHALLMPTVPITAPPIAPLLDSDELFTDTNLLLLRNPTLVNFLDGCALTLPCHRAGEAPVGLMLAGRHGEDARILRIGAAIERLLAGVRGA